MGNCSNWHSGPAFGFNSKFVLEPAQGINIECHPKDYFIMKIEPSNKNWLIAYNF